MPTPKILGVIASLGCIWALSSCSPTGADTSGTNYEVWKPIKDARVYDRAGLASDGSRTADRLDLESGDGLYFRTKTPILAGDTIRFSTFLWGKGKSRLSAQILSYCTDAAPEVQTVEFLPTKNATPFVIEHTFKSDQGCAQIQMTLITIDALLFGWQPRIEHMRSGVAVPAAPITKSP